MLTDTELAMEEVEQELLKRLRLTEKLRRREAGCRQTSLTPEQLAALGIHSEELE